MTPYKEFPWSKPCRARMASLAVAPGVRSGNVDALVVIVQTNVPGDRFVHGPSACKLATPAPTIGAMHWCSSARPGRATYFVARVAPPEFAKSSCVEPAGHDAL